MHVKLAMCIVHGDRYGNAMRESRDTCRRPLWLAKLWNDESLDLSKDLVLFFLLIFSTDVHWSLPAPVGHFHSAFCWRKFLPWMYFSAHSPYLSVSIINCAHEFEITEMNSFELINQEKRKFDHVFNLTFCMCGLVRFPRSAEQSCITHLPIVMLLIFQSVYGLLILVKRGKKSFQQTNLTSRK